LIQQATWASIPTARLGALSANLALPNTCIVNVGQSSSLRHRSQCLSQILLTLQTVGGWRGQHHIVINEQNHPRVTAIEGFEISWQLNATLGRNRRGEFDRSHVHTPSEGTGIIGI
jgi:hypothetical protein